MLFKAAFITKTFVTSLALKRYSHHMNVCNVLFENRTGSVTFAANVTFKFFDLVVIDFYVILKMTTLIKIFFAKVALESVNEFVHCCQMSFENSFESKVFLANVTMKFVGFLMNFSVFF